MNEDQICVFPPPSYQDVSFLICFQLHYCFFINFLYQSFAVAKTRTNQHCLLCLFSCRLSLSSLQLFLWWWLVLIKRKLREQIKERTRAQTSKISLLDLFFGLLLSSIETTMVDLYSLCLVLVLYQHTFIDFSSPSFIPFISQAAGRREERKKQLRDYYFCRHLWL